MTRHVALLRAINVGGRNKIPMGRLRTLLDGLGYTGVRTYLQSGNAVLTAPGSADRRPNANTARATISEAARSAGRTTLTSVSMTSASGGIRHLPELVACFQDTHVFVGILNHKSSRYPRGDGYLESSRFKIPTNTWVS